MAMASRGRQGTGYGVRHGAAYRLIACVLLLFLGTAHAEEKRLHIYNWADFIGTRTVQRFERQTGIKVVYDTYDAEETMEAKLLAGGSGYDVVSASTNFFSREIKAGVYRKLDKSKLPNWKNLDPKVLARQLPADPANAHAVPYLHAINGFTYNPATKKATFHIVNSWRVLAEFDVPVEARDEQNILMEQSLSPKGELPEQAKKIVAGAVTLLKPVGKQNLYSVETNVGPQKVLAASEEGAKQFVELDTSAKDMETIFGEFVIRIYDYIYENADPKVRDLAAAALLSEIFKIPPTVTLPHVDLEVKGALGQTYFVRVAPEKVVKLMAGSTGEALERARKMGGAK